jgi:hypothetical protein
MAEKTWELSGQYMESCNCDYLCPCIYTNPQAAATHEHCYALMVYRIDRGRHGAVSLDGLKFALVIRSGRVMADGGWVFGVVVDESARRIFAASSTGGSISQPTVCGASPTYRACSASRSRAWPRATARASRTTSTIQPIPPIVGSPSPGRKRPRCRASASRSAFSARAITGISRPSLGPPDWTCCCASAS